MTRALFSLFALFNGAALYYSTIQPVVLLTMLTAIYASCSAAAIFLMPFRPGVVIAAALSLAVFIWYLGDAPSNHRDWSTEYAITTAVSENGEVLTFKNIRNFDDLSAAGMVPHYYDASFPLNQLTSVDLVSSYWAGDAIAHIFLTFGFQDRRHLAISIETRRQRRFAYSTIAGFFHHYELFYVVADERDLIGVRTDIRHERVYLYRLEISPPRQRALLMSYVNEIERLSAHPEWYNTLTDNCTTGILKRAETPGRILLNWRIILSGYAPDYAYNFGLLNNSVSFQTLKAESLIIRPAGSTITSNFSEDIRKSLPLYPVSPQAKQ